MLRAAAPLRPRPARYDVAVTSSSEGQRVVRQLRHDLDDVYDLVAGQDARLEGIEGRLGRLEVAQQTLLTTQQQVLQLLQELRDR